MFQIWGIAIVAGLIIGGLLGRFAIIGGIVCIVLSFVPLGVLVAADELGMLGNDPSAQSMLATLISFAGVPFSITILGVGVFRRAFD